MRDKTTITQIKLLAKIESENINNGYLLSVKMGELYILNALSGFRCFLEKTDGKFINGMNINYRFFVVELLKNITPKYKYFALGTILGFRASS